jgi:hypothetical protein
MEPMLSEPATRPRLLHRYRTALKQLDVPEEVDTTTLNIMVQLMEKASGMLRVAARSDAPPGGIERVSKRKSPESLGCQGQALPVSVKHLQAVQDADAVAFHATSEPLASAPSLRTLLDSDQDSIFRPGGVADISIQNFENIRCQVASMHRVVLLHEVLLQAMRSRNVQDSLSAAKFVAAIDKAWQLDILSPAEAKFCYLEAKFCCCLEPSFLNYISTLTAQTLPGLLHI